MKHLQGIKELPTNYDSLSWQQRRDVRNLYKALQKEICCHCKGNLSEKPKGEAGKANINWNLFPPNFTQYPVHLHHNRKTGMTIGAVHAVCNAYLWQYKGE